MKIRNNFIKSLALVVSVFISVGVSAQSFPDKPIRLNVGFPAGTAPDLLARVVGQQLGDVLKQSVIVDNKPGAGAQIATQLVAKSAPDGYNLLIAEAGSVSIAPAAFSNLPYNPSKELVGVAELAWADFVLVVPQNSPYKTLRELVAANKGNTNALNFGTFGAGSPGHFLAVEFGSQSKLKVEPVHYRSTGDAVSAIISGDVTGAWVSTALASAQIKGGKVRGLAITGKARSTLIPEVPTTAEAGMPKLNYSSWLGVLAPVGTPDAVLDVLSKGFVQAVQNPEVKQKLVDAGLTVTGLGRVETNNMLKSEALRWGSIVKASGFKGD